jgi:hypothetical protein
MSLKKEVERLIRQRGASTVDHLLPHIDAERSAIRKAMQNLRSDGRLTLVRRGVGLGPGKGKTPSAYDIAARVPRRLPVSSVFQLGGML